MHYTKIGSFVSEPKFQVIGLNKYKINLTKLFLDIRKYIKFSSFINTQCKQKILDFIVPTIKHIKIKEYGHKTLHNLIKNLKLNIYYQDDDGKSILSIYDLSDTYYSNPHTFLIVKKKKKINTQKFSLTDINSNILLVSNSPIINIRVSGILLSHDYRQISHTDFIHTWFNNNNKFNIHTLNTVIKEVSIDNRDKIIDWIRQEFTGNHSYELNSCIVHDICNKLEKLKN